MKRKSRPTDEPTSQHEAKGETGLDRHYAAIWGDRWATLRASLATEPAKFILQNPFGLANYELDPASVVVARALDVRREHRVLDMCAAPGGKSLTQIFTCGAEATFVLNDLSRDRVFRLRRVLIEHLPQAIVAKIKVTGRDASRWGQHEKEAYHRVLLDAPCSGERHLLENASSLSEWSLKRTKGLAQRQYALLCSAEQVLHVGGRLVYSTCTLSPLESDSVIARYFERKAEKGRLAVRRLDEPVIKQFELEFKLELETTEFGYLILPDRSQGAGPMYFSLLEKTDYLPQPIK